MKKVDAPKRGRGRPRRPSPERLASGKHGARVWVEIDGESVRKRIQLDTTDAQVARKKLARVTAAPATPLAVVTAASTFWDEALVIHDERTARGVVGTKIELGNLRKHVQGFLGQLSKVPFGERRLGGITAAEVTELLVHLRTQGYSRTTVKHVRNGMKYVFDARGLAAVLTAAPLPAFKAAVDKIRAVLEDAELLVYLGYQHPIERFQVAVLMRQAMSCVSRCFGGQRTNDLHVATWDMYEIAGGEFRRGFIARTKSGKPQRLPVPEGLRPVLRMWWEHQGKPTTGPIFPLLRGKQAGQARVVQDSHAHAMRQDLMRAFGIYEWSPTGGKRKSGAWVQVREMTERERELFVESAYTLPVDFHSWRRAWSQALEAAGVNVQTSAALTGHAGDLAAHGRYLKRIAHEKPIPEGVVPDLAGKTIFGRELARNKSRSEGLSNDSGRARLDSNQGPLASEADAQNTNRRKTHGSVSPSSSKSDVKRRSESEPGQNSRPEISGATTLTDATLWELLALATKSKRTDLVQAVTEQIDALERATPPNVTRLDSRRRR